MSQAQQQYDSRTIPFKRGDILDRNGNILATSEKMYNVILDCHVVNTEIKSAEGESETPYVEPTITALVKVLGINAIVWGLLVSAILFFAVSSATFKGLDKDVEAQFF